MRLVRLAALPSLLLATACGGGNKPPPQQPQKPVDSKPVAEVIDLSPVPEPERLLVIGRVQKPDAMLKTVGGWASFPLPSASELAKSMSDGAVAAAIDVSQPIDGAAMLGGSNMSPEPVGAVAFAVKSLDDAKAKISEKHRLTPAPNGSFIVEGVGRSGDDDDGPTCELAPATSGGRLVCGDKKAVEMLTPYLTRSMPKQSYASDLHVELRFAPLRESVQGLRTLLPLLMGGSKNMPNSVRQLADAGVGELVDAVNDMNRMVMDAQIENTGATATVKLEYGSTKSTIAKIATSNADKADVPPAAFFHLPAETDIAYYSRGSDPKLLDHSRELLGNVMIDLLQEASMPEPERKAIKDLVVDRTSTLFTGAMVYGKGFDQPALDKALDKAKNVKRDDRAAEVDAERAVIEQVVGWHLVEVNEPITKVGPVLKDWAGIWARPAFKKWVKDKASAKMQAQLRIAANPAGVPKDSVHLEIVIPLDDLNVYPPPPPPPKPGEKAKPFDAKPKKIPQKPIVLHVLAVPDQGASWIGFGLDGGLLAKRAAAAISTGAEKDTIAKSPFAESVRNTKSNAGALFTLRGLLVFAAIKPRRSGPYTSLASLPNKGLVPMTFTVTSSGPSQGLAGTSTSTVKVPRAVIEDAVRTAVNSR